MHLIFHIFKKDVRRVWWGIAGAVLIQIAAACFDGVDSSVSFQLSLLLIVSWATLLALAIHEDPLVSDRQFWITRPARWRVLLGSKLLFAIAVVHVPSFLADVVLLAAHGFHPWESLASLLIKQLTLAALLTLPMIAIAAVLPGFPHLALAVIAIAGLTSFVYGFSAGLYLRWIGLEETRIMLVGAVLAAAAIAVIPWQFARRKTWPSRLVGLAGVLVAELLLAFLPSMFLARVRAAVNPAGANISFHLRTVSMADLHSRIVGNPLFWAPAGLVAMAVPLNVMGFPKGTRGLFDQEMLDLIGPDHQPYQIRPSYIGPDWLVLHLPREIFERFKNAKVELRGSMPLILYRNSSSASMPVGASGMVPGLGRCFSEVIAVPGPLANGERHRFLQVKCESPEGSVLPAFVNFRQSADNASNARLDWLSAPGLSPLKRTMASFTLSPDEEPQPSWRLEFTSEMPLGWQVVNLDLRELPLADYVNRPYEP